MNHNFYKSCDKGDCGGSCWFCTLSICKICRLYEGALTTDCPGEISLSKEDEIYNGKLDFREGEGWVKKLNPTNQSWLKSKIIDLYTGKKNALSKNEIILSFGISKEEYIEVEKQCIKYLYENKK